MSFLIFVFDYECPLTNLAIIYEWASIWVEKPFYKTTQWLSHKIYNHTFQDGCFCSIYKDINARDLNS